MDEKLREARAIMQIEGLKLAMGARKKMEGTPDLKNLTEAWFAAGKADGLMRAGAIIKEVDSE